MKKVTYQEKIDELQHAIDERDEKNRQLDQQYEKAVRLLTVRFSLVIFLSRFCLDSCELESAA